MADTDDSRVTDQDDVPTFRQLDTEGILLWSAGTTRCYWWDRRTWRAVSAGKRRWRVDRDLAKTPHTSR